MRADILRELGLSPVWKRRVAANAARAETPQRAAAPDIPEVYPANIPAENPAAARNSAPPAPSGDFSPPIPPPSAPMQTAAEDSAPISEIRAPLHAPSGGKPDAAAPPPEEESKIARMRWQPLRETVAGCRRCELCRKRKQAVFGVGDENADIFFVGEGPGQEEDLRGEPFVGAAGKLLNAMLKSIGIGRESGVYIANIVKCRPPQNRRPKPEEAEACMPYLHRQLELAKPRLIVALGGVAAAHLLQSNEPVGALRQRIHNYRGTPLVVTYHPAYLLRSPREKQKSWNDLLFIRRAASKTE